MKSNPSSLGSLAKQSIDCSYARGERLFVAKFYKNCMDQRNVIEPNLFHQFSTHYAVSIPQSSSLSHIWQNPNAPQPDVSLFERCCCQNKRMNRISEALALRREDIQISEGLIAVTSLKKRDNHHVRQIPIPDEFIAELIGEYEEDHVGTLFCFSRTTAWRVVCGVMAEAGITGIKASPKGLRHSFGVACAFHNIAMTLAQKWMGHADITTTAIYYQIVGREEREMAERLWT